MVNDGRYVLEEPLVRAVTDKEHIVAPAIAITSKLAPSSRDNRPNTCRSDSLEDDIRQLGRIINDDAAEADVDGWQTALQEEFDLWWWFVFWRVAEEETADA